MGNTNPWKTQQNHQSCTKKLLPYVLYALLPLVFLHFYLYPSPPLPESPTKDHFSFLTPFTISSSSLQKEQKSGNGELDSVSVTLKENENVKGNDNEIPTSASILPPEDKETVNEHNHSSLLPPKEKEFGNEILPEEKANENRGNEILPEEKANENSGNEILPEEKANENSGNEILAEEKANENSGNESLQEEKASEVASSCDYTNGEWVQDNKGPLYNGTSCGTIKDGQNCMSHGRPDTDYLYWKWKPSQCDLPRFDPQSFLQIFAGKHIAFVGDSMARNQLESLLCMLSSVSPPNLVYTNGDDNKFRRWHFASHNVVVSIYWSPFLVRGIEKSDEQNFNRLFFESVDERWGSDLDTIDLLVLSIGHWYLHPAVYREGDTELGCHAVTDILNCTETEFYGVYGKAFNTSLKAIMERKQGKEGNGIGVIVTTFSPHHFEGEWDKFGACPKTKPYLEAEKSLEGMDAQMREAQVGVVDNVKMLLNADNSLSPKVRLAALDVTKLALLRPDGHPGPYMYPNPFGDGIKDRVHNDCVHWCLPGPIDTWNEIMLDIVKKWYTSSLK